MKPKHARAIVLAMVLFVPQMSRGQATSRLVPFTNVPTNITPPAPAQTLTIQLFNTSTGGTPLYCENQTLDVTLGPDGVTGVITFNFGVGVAPATPCPSGPPELKPGDFISGESRFVDIVDTAGASVLPNPPGRIPLTAVAFALNPGPQGQQGIQGVPGLQGPPGVVQTVAAGDASISVGGTAADKLVSIAPNGVTNANVANGALSAAKITGTAATLGGNNFVGSQNISGPLFVNNPGGAAVDGMGFVGVRGATAAAGGFAIVGSAPANARAGQFNGSVRIEEGLSVGGAGTVAVTPAGNVGIGTPTPNFPLSFRAATGDKISLYGDAGSHYGFGVQPYLLQIHTDTNLSDIAFGSGTSAAFTETMRLKGNGNVGIGVTNPGTKLAVATINTSVTDLRPAMRGENPTDLTCGGPELFYQCGGNGVEGVSTRGAGVSGTSTTGPGVSGTSTTGGNGVSGFSSTGWGVWAGSTSSTALRADSQNGTAGEFKSITGNILAGHNGSPGLPRVFRVDQSGKVFANGGFQASGADFAESFAVRGDRRNYEPGDVLVIDSHGRRRMDLSRRPYSASVAGIYSTKPGLLGTPHGIDDSKLGEEIPLAIMGVVPCKVSAENGSIKAGDLLVTAWTAGYAMKATERRRMLGAVLGKALEPLASGKGVIQVLVVLQ
jgi:hypothetical protein